MNEENYSNREIVILLKNLKEQNDAKHHEQKETLGGILEQVKFTNGQVRANRMAIVAIVFLLIGLGFTEILKVLAVL